MILIHYFIVLATIFSNILVLFLALKSKEKNIGLIGIGLSLTIWSTASFFNFFVINNPNIAVVLARLLNSCIILIPIFVYYLYIRLLNINAKAYWFSFKVVSILNSCLAIVSLSSSLIVSSVSPRFLIKNYTVPGVWYAVFGFIFTIEILCIHLVLYKRYKGLSYNLRTKVKYIVLTILFSIFIGLSGFITSYFNTFFPEIGSVGASFYSIVITYVILKYRVLEIPVFISLLIGRVTTYIVYIALFIIFYIATHSSIVISKSYIFIMLFLIILSLESFKYIRSTIQKVPDSILKTQAYNLQDQIQQLSHKFEKSVSIQDLSMVIKSTFWMHLNIPDVRFFIREDFIKEGGRKDRFVKSNQKKKDLFDNKLIIDELSKTKKLLIKDELAGELKKILNALKVEIFVPCIVNGQVIAVLSIGKKEGVEGSYSSLDIKVFEYLRYQIGIVLDRMKMYEEIKQNLDQAKDRVSVIDNMSFYNHELKAAWTSLTLLSEIGYLKTTEQKEKRLNTLSKKIAKGWDYTEKTINTMTAMMTNQLHMDQKIEDINSIIDDSIGLLSNQTIDIEPVYGEVPNIKASSQELQLVFTNLIKNAIEAIKEAGIGDKIKIKTSYDIQNKKVITAISNNGPKIPENVINSIWSKGFSTKGDKGGTGIGLSAVKTIIGAHNGDINVKNNDGVGVCFTIIIPEYLGS